MSYNVGSIPHLTNCLTMCDGEHCMKHKQNEAAKLSLRMCPQLRRRLHVVAERRHISEAWIVKRCLEKALPEFERKNFYDLAA